MERGPAALRHHRPDARRFSAAGAVRDCPLVDFRWGSVSARVPPPGYNAPLYAPRMGVGDGRLRQCDGGLEGRGDACGLSVRIVQRAAARPLSFSSVAARQPTSTGSAFTPAPVLSAPR